MPNENNIDLDIPMIGAVEERGDEGDDGLFELPQFWAVQEAPEAPRPYEPPKVLMALDVLGTEDDPADSRIELIEDERYGVAVELFTMWRGEGDLGKESLSLMSLGEATQLHKQLGKMLNEGVTNT